MGTLILSYGELRVLHVVPQGMSPSAMVFVTRQMLALRELGIDVEAFPLRSRTSVTSLVSDARRLVARIQSRRFHIVHAQFGTMTAFFSAVCAPVPLVVTFRGSDLNPAPSMAYLRWGVGHLLSQLSTLRAATVICVSRQLQNRLWWPPDRVHVIPSGVDTEQFFPMNRDAARTHLGWPMDSPTVLFNAGAAPAGKRRDLAEAAISIARCSVPTLRFVVLDGNTEPSEVPYYINASDCLLFTSDWEGSPNIVKESLACNLPVVSVDVGDVQELFGAIDGVHIVGRTDDELGSALVQVIREHRRAQASTFVDAKLGKRKIARRISEVYQQILEDRSLSKAHWS